MFESKLNKGKNGGYPPLNINGKIPLKYLPPSTVAGATGPQGFIGATGNQGINGFDGATGNQGAQGDQGAQGIAGEGSTGATGANGTNGSTGPALFTISTLSGSPNILSPNDIIFYDYPQAVRTAQDYPVTANTAVTFQAKVFGAPSLGAGTEYFVLGFNDYFGIITGGGTIDLWSNGGKFDEASINPGDLFSIYVTSTGATFFINGIECGSVGVVGLPTPQYAVMATTVSYPTGFNTQIQNLSVYTTGSYGFTGATGNQGINGFDGATGNQGDQGFTGSTGPSVTTAALNYEQATSNKVTVPSAGPFPYTVISQSITTSGGPVQISVSGDANPSSAGWGRIQLYRDSIAIGKIVQFESSASNENNPYALFFIDNPTTGTYTYSLRVNTVTTNTEFGETDGPVLSLVELQNVVGATGSQGSVGATGITGATGSGLTGSTGSQGNQGFIGATGNIGNIGSTGFTGSTGTQGNQGFTGATGGGSTGFTGSTGTQGNQGFTGATGIQGTGGALGYYGSFYDTTIQTNATGARNSMRFNTPDISNGISIQNSSEITIANPGVYNIQFSTQLDKTDSGIDTVDIWLGKNGANIPDSNTRIELDKNNNKVVAAWNWVVKTTSPNEYFEIYWSSDDPDMRLYSEVGATGPTRPAIPSVILTVTQVMYSQSGSTGATGLIGATGGQGNTGATGAGFSSPYTGNIQINGQSWVTADANGNTTASTTVNWNDSNIQTFTLNTATTTFTFSNPNAGATYILVIRQNAAGSQTIVWPGTVAWAGGTIPTMTATANRYDVFTFIYDGSKYFGSYIQNFT